MAYAPKYLLGPECANLVRVTTVVPGPYAPNVKFRGMPKGDEELKSWQVRFDREHDETLIGQIWEPLLVHNSGLRRVSMNQLPGRGKKMVKMCKALDGLSQLEELHIGYSDPNQIFQRRGNYDQIINEPKTRIKDLSLFSSGRMRSNHWIIPVL
ncbi:hypothetical protein BGZ47_005177 [Haplosporangium gracile]|nr:hypothetical protein BGZ47_005177 [Haplosporangium gracile]